MNDTLTTLTAVATFLVAFPLFWVALMFVIGLISGWQTLAIVYPMPDLWQGPRGKWAWQSISLGWSSYGGIVQLAAYEEGLLFDVFVLFRPGHRPFFVPWEEMHTEYKQVLWQKYVNIRCDRAPRLIIGLPQVLATKIETAAGPRWPTAEDSI